MTVQELKQRLCDLAQLNDTETAHQLADDLLMEFLSQIDPEIKEAFESIKKWYS